MPEVVNAIFYILRAGCSWRMMPCAFYHRGKQYIRIFDVGNLKGYGKKFIQYCDSPKGDAEPHATRERVSQLRGIEGRDIEPSDGVIDSQTVKKTEKGGVKGYDARKKIMAANVISLLIRACLILVVVVHKKRTFETHTKPIV